MLKNDIIFVVTLSLSVLFFIFIFSSKKKEKQPKYTFLYFANIFAVISGFFYPFHVLGDMTILIGSYLILDFCSIMAIRSKIEYDQKTSEEWRNDPSNYRLGIFYFNPKDMRIFPPKRTSGSTWNVNFSNPYSVLVMISLILLFALVFKVVPLFK